MKRHLAHAGIDGSDTRSAGRFLEFGGGKYDLEHPSWDLSWDNAADDGPAINSALEWIGERGGGIVTLPEGTGRIATGILMRHSYLRLQGRAGQSVFNFDPPKASSAVRIGAADGSRPIAYCHVSDMRLTSPANGIAKTFLELVDSSQCAVYDMYCPEENWDSPGGMFLRTRGREFTRIGPNITFAGERFWVMSPNPNHANLGCDHAIMYGPLWLIGRGTAQNAVLRNRPCIEKEPGCPFTSFNTVGVTSINRFSQMYRHTSTGGGKTDASYSANLNFIGFRREQSPLAAGAEQFTMEVDGSGAYIRGLVIDNMHFGGHPSTGAAKGIKLVGVIGGSMRNVFYEGVTTALEIGGACDDIGWTEFFTNAPSAALVNSGGLLEQYSVRSVLGPAMPVRGHYLATATVYGDNTAEEIQRPPSQDGVFGMTRKITDLRSGGTFRLPVQISGVRKALLLEVVLYTPAGEVERGLWSFNLRGAAKLIEGTSSMTAGAPVRGEFGVATAGEFRTTMQNNMGVTVSGWYRFDFVT